MVCMCYYSFFVFLLFALHGSKFWATDIVRGILEQKEFAPLEVCSYDTTNKDRVGYLTRHTNTNLYFVYLICFLLLFCLNQFEEFG